MRDNRKLKRWHLIYYLRVFDQASGDLVGHVVDMSTEGLCLISARPIEHGRELALWLEYPDEDGEMQTARFEARSLWSRRDVNPQFHDTGFEVINATPDSIDAVRDMIEQLHFTGPPEESSHLHDLTYSGASVSHPGPRD